MNFHFVLNPKTNKFFILKVGLEV